jgi:hypothetical protein
VSACDADGDATRWKQVLMMWRHRFVVDRTVEPLVSLQPSVGTTDAENLLFVSYGANHISRPTDINEAERVEWIRLDSVRARITAGEIIGAASLVGLLHVLAFR